MRWYTCTPVEFGGGPDFFARDSGLLCRGFREIGIESRAVMPGARKPEDEEDLIRTEYHNLQDPEWWRSHRLDGVVLYAWGSPRYRHIARAIRESGAKLVLNQDSSGHVSPLNGLRAWSVEQWTLAGSGESRAMALRGILRILCGISLGLLRTDPLRAIHLRQGHLIACVSPDAAENYRRLCRIYGGRELAEKVVLLPHAVLTGLSFDPAIHQKKPRVIAIGRWDDVIQKRPGLLIGVLGRLLSENGDIGIDIVGRLTPEIEAWRDGLPDPERVILHGKLAHEKLAELLAGARIYYCPSAYESFNIAAAEALCCGCSVVAAARPTMASFRWFVSRSCGTLAATDDVAGHLRALLDEISFWEKGARDSGAISGHWTSILHADKIARRVLELMEKSDR
jgi:glycosyltransferase involved in cell wall biosynthesis